MHTIFYKLAWHLTPVVFFAFYFYKGAFCFMGSCLGNNNEGVVWGIGAVIIYSLLLKLIKAKGKEVSKEFWDVNGVKSGFFYYLIILIILFTYFVGKINS